MTTTPCKTCGSLVHPTEICNGNPLYSARPMSDLEKERAAVAAYQKMVHMDGGPFTRCPICQGFHNPLALCPGLSGVSIRPTACLVCDPQGHGSLPCPRIVPMDVQPVINYQVAEVDSLGNVWLYVRGHGKIELQAILDSLQEVRDLLRRQAGHPPA